MSEMFSRMLSDTLVSQPAIVGVPSWVKEYRMEDDVLVLKDGDGKEHRFIQKAMMLGHCNDCSTPALVEHNLGAMCCPHCTSTNVNWAWVKAKMMFVPEEKKGTGDLAPVPPLNGESL